MNFLGYNTTKLIKVGKQRITVKIRLSDPCKNGHNDFVITADIDEKDSRGYWRDYMGGCCHEEILKVYPQFKQFVDLHLSDFNGAPMYAVANGFYNFKTGTKETAIEYLRITEDEYNKLLPAVDANDEKYFQYLLEALSIPQRWKQEALNAIKELEILTGETFEDNSTRSNFTPLTLDELTNIGNKINSGYYDNEAIQDRKEAKQKADYDKIVTELQADRDKGTLKAENEYKVKIYVLNSGIGLDNFIYYSHTNEGSFNWKGYGDKITQADYDKFISELDLSQLPQGIKFSLK